MRRIQVIQRREGAGGLDLSSRCVPCSPFHLDEALPGVLVSEDAGLFLELVQRLIHVQHL